MAERRWLFPTVATGLLAALAWWGLAEREPATLPREAAVEEPRAAYYARDFELLVTNAAGAPDYRVRAPQGAYFDAADRWRFTEPRWRVYGDEGIAWYGRAEQGQSWQDGTRASLTGDVRLRRPGAEGDSVLRTEHLDLEPARRYAETDRLVTITGPNYRVQGVGARAWLEEERMQLLSQVEGRHDPGP